MTEVDGLRKTDTEERDLEHRPLKEERKVHQKRHKRRTASKALEKSTQVLQKWETKILPLLYIQALRLCVPFNSCFSKHEAGHNQSSEASNPAAGANSSGCRDCQKSKSHWTYKRSQQQRYPP